MTAADEVQPLKQRHHAMWAAGDYGAVAERVEEVAEAAVQAAAPLAGTDVLDVATGTGNAALLAAEQGAHVTALDLTPELFERAAALGVEVERVAGDAEDLPFADASFDRGAVDPGGPVRPAPRGGGAGAGALPAPRRALRAGQLES
jgi:SAM-dependent methyltransferase